MACCRGSIDQLRAASAVALTRLLSTPWTDDGSLAVEGLVSAPAGVAYPEEPLQAKSGASSTLVPVTRARVSVRFAPA